VRLDEIAERLGTAATSLASLSALRLEAIRARTRKDLLEVARWLELKGASRMPKNELAKSILYGLKARALRDEEDPSVTAKLDLGPAGKSEKPVNHIPWGYGQDRVVAAAVDPDRLYVYWEVTDTAIDRARSGLGPGGADAWLNLRVHDTTGLLFDGANANSYFDQRVERSDRQ